MHWFSYILLAGLLMACKTMTPSSVEQPFVGTFTGDISGAPTVLTLTQPDTTLSGMMNAGGYLYTLSGSVRAEVGRGVVYDPQTEGAMAFELIAVAEGVMLTLMDLDSTGQVQRVPLHFTRHTETVPDESVHYPAFPAVDPGWDAALVGVWSYYDYSSFEPAAHLMRLEEDGVYYYKNYGMVSGASSSADSLAADWRFREDAEEGRWGTQAQQLYVYEQYQMPEGEAVYAYWRPVARYHVEGDRMLLTHPDGSRQIWQRRRSP